MIHADSILNAWWLFPILWAALSLLASAALRSLNRDPAPEPEPAPAEPAEPLPFQFDLPDAMSETIGWYMGAPIHRSARFDGVEYEFDRICPPQSLSRASGERVVAPGIVYARRAAMRRAST
jgi:hypothetical protein